MRVSLDQSNIQTATTTSDSLAASSSHSLKPVPEPMPAPPEDPEPITTDAVDATPAVEAPSMPMIDLSDVNFSEPSPLPPEPAPAPEDYTPAPAPAAPAEPAPAKPTPKPVLTRSETSRPVRRPTGINNDALLRMLGEAFGEMMQGADDGSGGSRAMTDEEVELWLQQLLQLYDTQQAGSGSTVSALHGSLKKKHSWLRLGDVYSALLYLKGRSAVRGTSLRQ